MAHERAHDKKFTPGAPAPGDSRFEAAGRMWDERIGTARVQAANWRLAFFGASLCSLVSVIGLIVQSTKASVVPYLVEVEASGEVRLVGAVTEQDWSLGDSVMRAELVRFVRNLRSLTLDRHVLTQRFAYVRNHSTAAGNLQLDAMFKGADPFERFGREVRTVEVGALTALPGSSTAFRAQWREQVYSPGGDLLATEHYVGEFHLTITPPDDEATLKVNPLGVYVSFFDFSRTHNEGSP